MEVYRLEEGRYKRLSANEWGHYPISSMSVDLGIWQGEYENMTLPWLRWWDSQGNLLLTGREQAQQERQRADRLAERLRQMGVNPDEV